MTAPRRALLAAIALGAILLSGCAPEPGDAPSGSASPPRPSELETQTPDATGPGSPSPSPSTTTRIVAIPDDCRGILSEAVLSELGETPLNDPAFGPSGTLPDGSLVCVWRSPAADATSLRTEVSRIARGPVLDMFNEMADEKGYTCYTPDGGTRCEKSWTIEATGAPAGRTLFWREDVLIDTEWSNLAPSGYTDAIVERVFG